MKTVLAIRHVHFEDLGTLEPLLRKRNYEVRYCDVGAHDLDSLQIEKPELLVVLGAPIGAGDENIYPFLTRELKLIEERLNARRPLLGICLGAQLMARVLGASISPMERKEIGFSPIVLTAAGHKSVLADIPPGTAVLHWHGDQFAIPEGVESLATTLRCPHQAFAVERTALGLQFHLEAEAEQIESWLIGHVAELAQAGIDPSVMRAQARDHGAQLKTAANAVFSRWLDQIEERPA